jgi:TonB-dependent receptor
VFSYTLDGVGLQFDSRGRDRYFPAVIQTAGPDITNIDNYGDNVLNIDIKRGDDEYQGVAFNVRKDFSTAMPIWIKSGVRLRTQTRELSRPRVRWRYAGPDRVLNSGDENLHQFMNMSVKTNGPVILPFPARTFRDSPGTSYDYAGYNIGSLFRSDRTLFVEDIAFNVSNEQMGRQSFEEKINAAYVMGNVKLGWLSVLGGVRFEETKTWGEGSLRQVTPEERARRAAWQGPVTPTELRRRTFEEYHRRDTATGQYDDVFPGLHLKFEPVSGLVGRASYSTNIGRPTIGNIVPTTNVNIETRTISTSNPSLLPQFADNFDLGVEYYYEPAGMISVGAFYKDISGFHFSQGGIIVDTGSDNGFGGDYAGYTLSTRRNGGKATVKGIELAWQQQFSFLPGWLSGLGAFANYTRLETRGDYGGTATLSTNSITGFVPEAANVGISYIRSPFSIRVQLKHRGKFLDDFNEDPDRLIWQLAQTVVDVKTQYNINEHFGIYMDVFNIFNDPNREFEWGSGRPQNIRKDSVMFLFGVNARL